MPLPSHSQSMSNLQNHRVIKMIRGKTQQQNAERLKVQKELFGFQRDVRHGFPAQPTSLAWDDELQILAVGTKQGGLRIYGQPGVEFYGQHETETAISQMMFLPGEGRLVTLTEDNFLHMWEINGEKLEEKKSTHLEGRLKKISVLCHDPDRSRVLLGTEGGNIYHLKLAKFTIDENIIYQDIVMKGAPEDFKVNPGSVEAVLLQPNVSNKVLIGYARGLIVLWDLESSTATYTYVSSQQLESLAWRNDGSQFISAHNDGSFVIWSTQGSTEPLEPPNAPYGPYPCKAINKILWAHQNGSSWTVFDGGMPRASYGDKHTVTVMLADDEDQQSVFDLSSKVIDFQLFYEDPHNKKAPSGLFILTNEELVTIDLTSKEGNWPVFSSPYLNSIHASAITCMTHVFDVKDQVYEQLVKAGEKERRGKVSEKPWPVKGGKLNKSDVEAESRDVLVTGHEDGSVKIWSCGGIALAQLCSIKTNKFFAGDDLDEPFDDEEDEDEWPPFKKVGAYDPYSDDPRLAIKKVTLCPSSGKLVVGGTAGQVIILEITSETREAKVEVLKADLVTEKEGFAWKGHSALSVRTEEVKLERDHFHPLHVLQVSPPASINSLAFSAEWSLLAAGTAHGLVILDCVHGSTMLTKCTLNAQDIANADDNPMSRRKSLKKSLRESFRRLRKGRSQRNVEKKKPPPGVDPIKKELRSESPESSSRPPVERQVEARSGSEDGLGSMVRCLHFANTFIANPQTLSATLWAGTNSGQILVFLLTVPEGEEKRKTEKSTAILGKEIQLKHKAPVISIEVLDATGLPLTASSANSAPIPHRVLIASEEQFKTFLLPTLKPSGKYKLTAHEGARIRRIGFTTFQSKADETYSENCMMCLTNQGDVLIHSLPELRKQIQTSCMKREDVIGISSLVFSPLGEAFFSCSSSELERINVSAARSVKPKGELEIAPEKRVPVVEETIVPVKTYVCGNNPNSKSSTNLTAPSESSPSANDTHNETTASEMSGDITLDSVKDHTMNVASASVAGASSISTTETVTARTATTTKEGIVAENEESGQDDAERNEETSNLEDGEEVNGQSQTQNEEVNGLLSKKLNSTSIGDTLTQELDNEAPLASLESTYSEFPSMISANYAGLKNDEEDQSRDADQDEEKKE